MNAYDGVPPAELARRLGVPACLVLSRVTSTMDVLHQRAQEGAPAGTIVLADEQVAGRGRHGRPWESPAGKGVWLAVLVRPGRSAGQGLTAVRIGLAAAAAIEELGASIMLKWPNDLIARDRKLGGILCEARWSGGHPAWIAIGVGVNVHGPLSPAIAPGAIALDALIPGITRVELLERLVPRLTTLSDEPTLSADERSGFAGRDWLHGRRLTSPAVGRAEGVDMDGALLVETESGVTPVHGGTVVVA